MTGRLFHAYARNDSAMTRNGKGWEGIRRGWDGNPIVLFLVAVVAKSKNGSVRTRASAWGRRIDWIWST